MSETLLSEESSKLVPDTKENEASTVSHDAKRKQLHPSKVVITHFHTKKYFNINSHNLNTQCLDTELMFTLNLSVQ